MILDMNSKLIFPEIMHMFIGHASRSVFSQPNVSGRIRSDIFLVNFL